MRIKRIGQSAAKYRIGKGSTTSRKAYSQVRGNGKHLYSPIQGISLYNRTSTNSLGNILETWKDIDNYEGLYQVSNLGEVKSLARTVHDKNGKKKTFQERLLKPDVYKTSHSNYLRVTLCSENVTKRYSIHRLVADSFIPNVYKKSCVNHIDNNAENNQVSNLEWCTHSENMIHAQKQGRLFISQSSGGKIGGLISAQVRKDSINALQGTYVGSWFIKTKPNVIKGKKAYVHCECSCGTQQLVEVTRLMRRETTRCRSCGNSSKKMKI